MGLHFSKNEFAERKARVPEAMAARGLDGLLMFKHESMYWLTGYDTFGSRFFLFSGLLALGVWIVAGSIV